MASPSLQVAGVAVSQPGEWLEGSTASDNINPSDTRDVIGAFARADVRQAETAIAAAHAAQPQWAAATPQRRRGAQI